MSDILDDLSKVYEKPLRAGQPDSDVNVFTSQTEYSITADVLGRAIAEITRLSRIASYAGAATAGPSYADIAKDARHDLPVSDNCDNG